MKTRWVIVIAIIGVSLLVMFIAFPAYLFRQSDDLLTILYVCTTGLNPNAFSSYKVYDNGTHTIDMVSCTWKENLSHKSTTEEKSLPAFEYIIQKEDTTYGSSYLISGGKVNDIIYDEISNSLIVSLTESNEGYLQIVIQTGILHMPIELPFIYFVLIDGEEAEFEELSPIMLKIPFDKGTKQIEIIGAYLT